MVIVELLSKFLGKDVVEWLVTYLLTYFLPFIIIFAVFFAILQKIKLFGELSRKINFLLAFAITIAIGIYKPEIFKFFSFYLFQIGVSIGVFALVAVIVAVVSIVVIWSFKTAVRIAKTPQQRIDEINREIFKTMKKLATERNVEKRLVLTEKIKNLEMEKKVLEAKIHRPRIF